MDAQLESQAAAPRPARDSGRGKGQAFELKGIVAPLTALRLRSADTAAIAKQLVAKVAQMPQFFHDAAVLVDLSGLGEDASRVHFGELAALLRSCKMVPVAITNAEPEVRARAASAGFGYVAAPAPRPDGRKSEARNPGPVETPAEPTGEVAPCAAPAIEPAAAQAPERAVPAAAPTSRSAPSPSSAPATPSILDRRSRASHRPPMVIHQPVRSGQLIYAEGTDLLVLAPVNSGAEVMADGHVHIYSTLRGRAVAGARGMTDARIFCQKLDAELVAISGAFVLSDDLPAERRGKPAQIYLEDGVCRVSAL